jgi:hypothetical protein
MDFMDSRASLQIVEIGEDRKNEAWEGGFDDIPIVTVDRKKAVRGSFIAACVLGLVLLAASFKLFGKGAMRNLDGFMLLFIGVSIASACFAVAVWIRARWICVGVLDETGVIASTLSARYELTWDEIVGARSYSKLLKDAHNAQFRVMLLLEGSRCIEAPIAQTQIYFMTKILNSAKFKSGCEGQQLGTTKGLSIIVFGCLSMAIGLWWAGHAINQFNNGALFRGGNVRVILFKIAAATVVPFGGFASVVWGIYHTATGSILYKSGYLAHQK